MSTVSQPTAFSATAFVAPVRVSEPTPKRWTRAEYHRLAEQGWFQDQRVELFDGEIIVLSPRSPQHAYGSDRVREALQRVFGDDYWVRHQFPLVHGDYSEPEPDISVVRGSREEYRDHHPTTAMLIVEVSRSSLRYDKQTKPHLYASMGVPEYWVLDYLNRQLLVYRDPKPDDAALFGHAYKSTQTLDAGAAVSPLERPQAILAVAELLPPA